jgi:proline-specific peptidase
MPFVEIENGKLYYETNGKGRPLLLIHGAWASHEWWRWQVPELSTHYQVLTFDVRGHGQSSRLDKPCSVDIFVRDVEALLQAVGLKEVAIVGWSMGGIISMHYCLNYPSRVKALILLATRGQKNPQMKRRVMLQHLIARLILAMDLASPRKYDRVARRFPGERRWVEREVRSMLSPGAPKEVFDWVVADIFNNPRESYFEIARSIWDWEVGEDLVKIKIPTLIMVGERDNRTPPHFSRFLHSRIPDSKLIIIKKAGHCLPLECYEEVNREIISFLKVIGY